MNMHNTSFVCAISAAIVLAATPAAAQNADATQNSPSSAKQTAPQDAKSQKNADKAWEKQHLVGGMGGKDFAVPYDAFQRPSDKDVLVLKQDSDLAHVFSTDTAAAQSSSGHGSGASASNDAQASAEPQPQGTQTAPK
jgi:hypothetical protein